METLLPTDAYREVGRRWLTPGVGQELELAWALVTVKPGERERVLRDLLGPLLGRDPETLGNLPIGSRAQCAEALAAYAEAGAGLILVWPLRDARAQLELLADAWPR